jgi:succinate dehydrogenase/fumarate reductase flavoprotein subunit
MIRALERLADAVIETDFLIVGGGLAGCMAAIRARQGNTIDVAIMEKAAIKTSGEVTGLDHHRIGHPAISGMNPAREAFAAARSKGFQRVGLQKASVRDSLAVLPLMVDIGVKLIEDDGTFKMAQMQQRKEGGPIWGRPLIEPDKPPKGELVYYRGADLKEKLARAALKGGARVFNRTMLTGLITKDGAVVGATGVNTRTGQFLVFKAKTVLLATGGHQRMYTYPFAPFPTGLFYSFQFPANHGGATVAAYRAGAKVSGLEFVHVGVLSAGIPGGAGMFWMMKNSKGEYLEQKYPMWQLAGKIGFTPPTTAMAFSPGMQVSEIERDIVMFDATKATDDEIACMYFTNAAESPNLLKFNRLRGDPRTAPPLEIRPLTVGLGWGLTGVVPTNDVAETSIKNLFVAGDSGIGTGSGPGAVTWGYRIGGYVREKCPDMGMPSFDADQMRQVEEEKGRVLSALGRKGESPLELEDYVRKINNHYVGLYKTGPRLKRALELHTIVREKFVPALGARTPHELMRVLEVEDIVELSQLHARASLMRNESRFAPSHYRVDYPEQDDTNWQKSIVAERGASGEARFFLDAME